MQAEKIDLLTLLRMQDLYGVLHLKRDATPADIRRAYRRLALRHHPDVDQTPGAKERFQSILDAYQVLSDPALRARYDRAPAEAPGERMPPKPQWKKRRSTGVQGEVELILAMTPFLRWFSGITAVCCLVLIADFFMPAKEVADRIISMEHHRGFYQIRTDGGGRIELNVDDAQAFHSSGEIRIRVSPILHFMKEIQSVSAGVVIRSLPSVYGMFGFVPVLLVLLSSGIFVAGRDLRTRYYLGVTQFIIGMVSIPFFVLSIW